MLRRPLSPPRPLTTMRATPTPCLCRGPAPLHARAGARGLQPRRRAQRRHYQRTTTWTTTPTATTRRPSRPPVFAKSACNANKITSHAPPALVPHAPPPTPPLAGGAGQAARHRRRRRWKTIGSSKTAAARRGGGRASKPRQPVARPRGTVAPSRRSHREVRPTGLPPFLRQQMQAMREERLRAQAAPAGEDAWGRGWLGTPSPVRPMRGTVSLNDLSDGETTLAVEGEGEGGEVVEGGRQSQSLPLHPRGGRPSAPFLPTPRHTIEAVVDGCSVALSLTPLVAEPRDPRRLSDADLSAIPLFAVATLLTSHLRQQWGRDCSVRRWDAGGVNIPHDATALALFTGDGGAPPPRGGGGGLAGDVDARLLPTPYACRTYRPSPSTPTSPDSFRRTEWRRSSPSPHRPRG